MKPSRRDLFSVLAALGGVPLIAKKISAPERLILDPGEVVQFDWLARAKEFKIEGWGASSEVARIPVTHRAALQLMRAGHGKHGGFVVVVKPANGHRNGFIIPDTVVLDCE